MMNTDISKALGIAAGILLLALGVSAARGGDYLDGDTATRIVLCAIGLMLAWYGNRAPKAVLASDHARQVTRVAGWSMALSGLLYAALWAFAPIPIALAAGCGAIIAGMAVTFAYCRSIAVKAR